MESFTAAESVSVRSAALLHQDQLKDLTHARPSKTPASALTLALSFSLACLYPVSTLSNLGAMPVVLRLLVLRITSPNPNPNPITSPTH